MSKIPKPPINVLLAHPTNMWSRWAKVNGVYTFIEFKNIVLHYVGAVSTAKDNAVYLNRDANLGWSAHFFVDEREIWQSVDFDHAAGHCGVDYSNGRAPFQEENVNKKSIGIEMCCKKDSNGNWYIEPETVTRTVALVKWLMQEFNIPISRVVRHYDVCWKTCPEPWVRYPEQWQAFKKRLTEEEEEMQRFKTVKELPSYYQDSVEKLIKLGIIKGRAPDNLDITEDMVRVAIWFGRMTGVLEGG